MVSSSIGYLLEKSASNGVKWGHVQGPRCQFWTYGAMRFGRFGGPILVSVSNYVSVAT